MNQRGEEKGMEGGEEEKVLVFMDSLDSYLTLLDSLSSTLRQGWLELASARHSMGSSRISSVLFDLKEKSASTTLQVTESIDNGIPSEPHYTLSKWGSLREEKCSVETDVGKLQRDSYTSELRHRGSSHPPEIVEETHKTAEVSHISGGNNVSSNFFSYHGFMWYILPIIEFCYNRLANISTLITSHFLIKLLFNFRCLFFLLGCISLGIFWFCVLGSEGES
ncbi:coiled-coil domain-containing protein 115 isoform X2 [Iris pallida]|uniref:Vacuolar ATPase assembly protein VMA22 n=1 Tax=Iris pallida TaxID=29817 RepID=A0AAX6F0T3_IRIPA|nr:coiled-coil domain-containing protein 115 isoform X2 [Iris pallida]